MFGKPLLFAGTSDPGAGSYNIGRSLRLDGVDDYYSLTLGTPTNRYIWTLSLWIKLGKLGTYTTPQTIFSAVGNDSLTTNWSTTDVLEFTWASGTGTVGSSRKFRDTGSWYHILYSVGLTKAVATDRLKIFVNGESLYLDTGSIPAQNTNMGFNTAVAHKIGAGVGGVYPFNGYMAEVNFLDGLAATPDMFGYKNEITGQWLPRAYTGTASSYGNNGFYLPFSDTTSTTTLGYDQATVTGLHDSANNWTPSGGLSRTAGVDDCSVIDTPTNNFCTWNPLSTVGANTYTKGNLTNTNSSYNYPARGSISVSSGKWYFEWQKDSGTDVGNVGVCRASNNFGTTASDWSASSDFWVYLAGTGNKFNGTWPGTAYGSTYTTELIGVALDLDNGAIYFSRSGTWQNSGDPTSGSSKTGAAYGNLSGETVTPFTGETGTGGITSSVNFGQRPFTNSPPAGYQALCTQNLPQPTIHNPKLHFDVKTYTGNGGNLQVGEIAKAQDLVVIDKSLRFRDENSAYLSKTLNTTGNRQIWTWSGWVKRSEVGSGVYTLFSAGPGSNTDYFFLAYNYSGNDDKIVVLDIGGASSIDLRSTSLQRNTSSFMHVVLAVDTTQGTASNKVKVYVDGVRITSFSTETYPGVLDTRVNYNGHLHYIGAARFLATSSYFSGYLSDVYFVDGLALLPSDFAQYDGNGYWVPKAYTGSYGNNGFHLEFEDVTGTTPATLGKDTSGVNVISGQTCTTNGTTSVTAITGTTQPQVNMVVTGGDFATGTYITAVGGSSGSWNCTLSTAATGSHTSHAVTFTGNNWSMSGFSVTEGADYDSVVDTPTNTYPMILSSAMSSGTGITVNDGGLEAYLSGAVWYGVRSSSTFPRRGMYYFESQYVGASQAGASAPATYLALARVGVATFASLSPGTHAFSIYLYSNKGVQYNGNTFYTYSGSAVNNDIIQFAIDCDNNTVYLAVNNVWVPGSDPVAKTGGVVLQYPITDYTFCVYLDGDTSPATHVNNFGQRPFTTDTSTDWRSAAGGYFRYDPPTGYKALSENNISEYLYDVEKPDVVWIKNRDQTDSHMLFDSVRGVGKYIKTDPDTSESEATDVNSLIQFNKNGFYLGNMNEVNTINEKYVAWLWKGAGGQASWNFDGDLTRTCTISLATPGVVTLASNGFENGQAVKFTTTGTLPSGLSPSTTYYVVNVASTTFSVAATVGGTAINTTSAGSGTHTCEHATKVCSNPTAGISVVQYAGHGTAGKTYGHGLTVKPSFILIKRLLATSDWRVYHSAQGATKYAAINSSAAFSTNSTVWNDVEPTSSVFTLGSDGSVNWADYRYIAYCFAEVPGFSKFGSYTGNGSADGPFVYCGFRPKWILVKRSDAGTENWWIADSSRSEYNLKLAVLSPSQGTTEDVGATNTPDIYSNGFKPRSNTSYWNSTGATYIFMAFAETPFKYANAR